MTPDLRRVCAETQRMNGFRHKRGVGFGEMTVPE